MKDVDLLYEDSGKLIEKYQDTVTYIVSQFVRSGFIKISNKDDFKQDVLEQLLLKIPKIKQSYNSNYQLSTYLSAIIRNICLEKIRKDRITFKNLVDNPNAIRIINNTCIYNLALTDEISRLENIFLLFNKQKDKLRLCLKAFFRIPVSVCDILNYIKDSPISNLDNYINYFNSYDVLTNQDLFAILTEIINAKEKKNNSADAIRKWLNTKIEEIIFLMNGNPKRANYDKESFQILIENYFYKKGEKFSYQETKINIDI
jgi:RNA polymerase sigma factor (sigma-70 family)